MSHVKVLAIGCSLMAGSLPVLVWPFILLPNVMALGASAQSGEEPGLTVNFLLWGSTTYPLAYLVLTAPAIFFLIKGKITASLLCALCLLGYAIPFLVVIVSILLSIWRS